MTSTHYDYDLQCWIVGGKVDKCGHTTQKAGCYACQHWGEEVDPSGPILDGTQGGSAMTGREH